MAHRFTDEKIEVEVNSQRKRLSFCWRDRHWVIAKIITIWTLKTLWWDDEVGRCYVQVVTTET